MLNQYDVLENIGEGVFSSVFKSVEKQSGKVKALKMVGFGDGFHVEEEDVENEIFILEQLQPHPSVVTFDRGWKMDYQFALVFDCYPTDLSSFIYSDDKKYDKSTVKKWMYQLLSAMHFCHSKEIIHCDVKPQNIMVDKDHNLKIADFGSSVSFHNEYFDIFFLLEGKTHKIQTITYKAPEIMLGIKRYSFCIDFWSVGCIMAELLTGKILFSGHSEIGQLYEIFRVMGTPNEESWPGVNDLPYFESFFPNWKKKDLSEEYDMDVDELDLLEKLLTYCPEERIAAKNAMKHCWLEIEIN
jgi:cyclin-dependent kinase 3